MLAPEDAAPRHAQQRQPEAEIQLVHEGQVHDEAGVSAETPGPLTDRVRLLRELSGVVRRGRSVRRGRGLNRILVERFRPARLRRPGAADLSKPGHRYALVLNEDAPNADI